MKEKHIYQLTIKAAALFVLMVAAWKCTAQQLRIETAAGLVTFAQSDQPDEICFSFGVEAGELKAEHLDKTARTLPGRVAAAARMANDAGVKYPGFCRENQINDSPAIQEYYRKCRDLRRQFLAVMPERVFLEIQHITQNFIQ
jgi:hypothetical protein